MSELSQRINRAILDASLSYGELAKLTAIPKSALQRYATGETEKVPLDRVERIAEATGVSNTWLLGWDAEKPLTIKSEELSDIKRILIEKILSMDDLRAESINKILDSILEIRDK